MVGQLAKKQKLLNEAQTRFAAGDYRIAAGLFRELDRAEPGNASILFQLGNAESLSGNLPDAIRHLSKALRLKPDDAATLAQLAICFRQAGRLEDALATSERAVKAGPDHPFAFWAHADIAPAVWALRGGAHPAQAPGRARGRPHAGHHLRHARATAGGRGPRDRRAARGGRSHRTLTFHPRRSALPTGRDARQSRPIRRGVRCVRSG
ncbi:MAG: tetratricopeptide repeat protein, partial [Phycisphaerales bacterium]|nr:tetratricopeptide repeat protein [Phycisphaerales bacterium]